MTPLPLQAHWQCVEFLSDVHLHDQEPQTARAWAHSLTHSPADAFFILGDLFEVWIGDDDDDPFVLDCIATLHTITQHRPIYFLCGNRDFLAGSTLMQRTGMIGLPDPTVIELDGCRFVLSHGDALCLDDTEYLAFRAKVRRDDWQRAFLALPLSERRAQARGLRQASEARKQQQRMFSEVDAHNAVQWLTQANAQVLIHGHTHRPGVHDLGPLPHQKRGQRWVLSDWDARAEPPRLERTLWHRHDRANGHNGLRRVPLADLSV